MTTATITPEQHLTVVKHLAAGKSLDVVASMTHLGRSVVLDIGSTHGFPDVEKLAWAVDVLTKKRDEAEAPTEHPDALAIAAAEQRRAAIPHRPAAVTSTPTAAGQPLTRPDEIRALINTAKGHPSKRVQAAGDKVIDAIDRLKALLREDEQKHAEKRRQEAERTAAKAEVDRLTRALAEARAKLKPTKPAALETDGGVTSAELRAWARDAGVECNPTGRVPQSVRDAYAAAHPVAS